MISVFLYRDLPRLFSFDKIHTMTIKTKYKKLIILLVIAVLAVSVWGAWYVIYSRYVKYVGIDIKPSRDHDPIIIKYYLQNDLSWASDNLGSSTSTLGGAGCLISSLASAITHVDSDIDPQQLNNKLTAVDAYTDDGELIWYKIKDAIPSVDYRYTRVPSSATIEKDLREGRLPIVNVRFHKNGVTHWVLIVGTQDGEFLISDPLNHDLTYLPLSIHGKIYAYRVIVKAQQ